MSCDNTVYAKYRGTIVANRDLGTATSCIVYDQSACAVYIWSNNAWLLLNDGSQQPFMFEDISGGPYSSQVIFQGDNGSGNGNGGLLGGNNGSCSAIDNSFLRNDQDDQTAEIGVCQPGIVGGCVSKKFLITEPSANAGNGNGPCFNNPLLGDAKNLLEYDTETNTFRAGEYRPEDLASDQQGHGSAAVGGYHKTPAEYTFASGFAGDAFLYGSRVLSACTLNSSRACNPNNVTFKNGSAQTLEVPLIGKSCHQILTQEDIDSGRFPNYYQAGEVVVTTDFVTCDGECLYLPYDKFGGSARITIRIVGSIIRTCGNSVPQDYSGDDVYAEYCFSLTQNIFNGEPDWLVPFVDPICERYPVGAILEVEKEVFCVPGCVVDELQCELQIAKELVYNAGSCEPQIVIVEEEALLYSPRIRIDEASNRMCFSLERIALPYEGQPEAIRQENITERNWYAIAVMDMVQFGSGLTPPCREESLPPLPCFISCPIPVDVGNCVKVEHCSNLKLCSTSGNCPDGLSCPTCPTVSAASTAQATASSLSNSSANSSSSPMIRRGNQLSSGNNSRSSSAVNRRSMSSTSSSAVNRRSMSSGSSGFSGSSGSSGNSGSSNISTKSATQKAFQPTMRAKVKESVHRNQGTSGSDKPKTPSVAKRQVKFAHESSSVSTTSSSKLTGSNLSSLSSSSSFTRAPRVRQGMVH